MTDFSLGAQWVERVTSAPDEDVSTIGADFQPAPDIAELHSVLRQLAVTPTAREMERRRWLQPTDIQDSVTGRARALYDFLFARPSLRPRYAMFRGRRVNDKHNLISSIAMMAWVSRVVDTARVSTSRVRYDPSRLDANFLRSLAKLSAREDGPRLATAALLDIGIEVVFESGLPGMSVDGAALHNADVGPLIALTLRYDRLDNFWFTLMHELGHIALHLTIPQADVFVDSLEDDTREVQETEAEADAYAKDSLIARDVWHRSDARRFGTERHVLALASQLGIHPAIVAGRIRHERRDFRALSSIVGEGSVRGLLLGNG